MVVIMVGNLKFEPDYKDGRYLCWLLPYLNGSLISLMVMKVYAIYGIYHG